MKKKRSCYNNNRYRCEEEEEGAAVCTRNLAGCASSSSNPPPPLLDCHMTHRRSRSDEEEEEDNPTPPKIPSPPIHSLIRHPRTAREREKTLFSLSLFVFVLLSTSHTAALPLLLSPCPYLSGKQFAFRRFALLDVFSAMV